MKDQVTSFEQSKRLIETGVPAQKASMVWEMDEDCARLKIWNMDKKARRILHNKYPDYYVPAYTVADLLGIIKPIDICPDMYTPCLEKNGDEGEWVFEFGQILGDEDFGYGFNHSLIDLLVGRIEWMVSNGYELNLQ